MMVFAILVRSAADARGLAPPARATTTTTRAFMLSLRDDDDEAGVQGVSLLQHFQRARGDARRARHATSCSAQLFARSGEWRARRRRAARAAGWNAPARSDAICSEFSFGSVLFAWIVRACRRALALDWSALRVIHGRTLLCTVVIARSDPRGKLCCLKHLRAVFVRARGCAKPSGVGWRSVPHGRSAGDRGTSGRGVHLTPGASHRPSRATRTQQSTSPPSPLWRRRRARK